MNAAGEIIVTTVVLLWLLPTLAAALRDWAAAVRACVSPDPDAADRESRYERIARVTVLSAYIALAFGTAVVFVVLFRRASK